MNETLRTLGNVEIECSRSDDDEKNNVMDVQRKCKGRSNDE